MNTALALLLVAIFCCTGCAQLAGQASWEDASELFAGCSRILRIDNANVCAVSFIVICEGSIAWSFYSDADTSYVVPIHGSLRRE